MGRTIVNILAVIGGLVVAGFALLFLIGLASGLAKPRVADKTILELNLETAVREEEPADPFARLASQDALMIRDILDGLEKAGNDAKVSGLIANIGAAPMSLAHAQEIRDAVIAFRAKKKFAMAYSETFGEFGPGNTSYYLATAFDEIWLQPSGDVGLNGFLFESMFLRGTFDKLGIIPRMDHRYEYKNAMNQYTEKKMTPPHREAMDKIKESFFSQMVRGIAAGRKMQEPAVRALVDKGPFLGKESLDAKLVDGMGYRDEVFQKAHDKAGSGSKLLYLKKYLDRSGRPNQKGTVIALIGGHGAVVRGRSDSNPFQDAVMGSDTVAKAFRDAIKDDKVKAILFRVDSPGGSYVASDTIWRETLNAKKAGKPVIVSMGSVAGSGGYFVAMAADKIVAQPGTITGSIGVLGGKMLTSGLTDKLGLSFDGVAAGQHAEMFSPNHDYDKEEWAKFQGWLDRVYGDFTSKVAEGRKLPKEKVLEIAKGRIWSGEDAKALGLVDEVGGYPVAIKLAKQAAKLKDTDEIELRSYPRKKEPFQALMEKLSGDESESSEARRAEVMLSMFGKLKPLMKAAGILDKGAGERVLAMPEFQIR